MKICISEVQTWVKIIILLQGKYQVRLLELSSNSFRLNFSIIVLLVLEKITSRDSRVAINCTHHWTWQQLIQASGINSLLCKRYLKLQKVMKSKRLLSLKRPFTIWELSFTSTIDTYLWYHRLKAGFCSTYRK